MTTFGYRLGLWAYAITHPRRLYRLRKFIKARSNG